MLLDSNNTDLNSFPLSVLIIILPKAVFSFQLNVINMILKQDDFTIISEAGFCPSHRLASLSFSF